LRKDFWNNDEWNVHAQRVIDHLSEDRELRFLALIDAKGKVIAHSDHARVGAILTVDLPEPGNEPVPLAWAIHHTSDYGRVFEAVRQFFPVRSGVMSPRLMREGPGGPGNGQGFMMNRHHDRRPMLRLFADNDRPGERYYAVAGLDMAEFDQTLGRLQMQIVLLSLAMLLVGLGGWLSLSAVQGYRVSQKTIEDMQVYTALLIARLPIGVIATDAQGRIATWNEAVSQLTGIARNRATGRRPAEVLPAPLAAIFSDNEAAQQRQAAMLERKAGLRLVFGTRRSELRCHLLPITDSEQQYRGKVLLISDITEIRLLEQRMRESERLAAVGRMAGGVAHEVRNPLSSIKGLALLLKHKFPEHSRERDTADLLIQETERMNRTITEMLSFTRPAPLRLEPVDLRALLQRCLELVRTEAADSGVVTNLEVANDLPTMEGEADRLQQVLMNVLLNGLQAMEEGGWLSVTAAVDDDGVELRIADTGRGIAPELHAQVFFPYFTTKPSGSGIGLAISQKIVADHHGTIEIESEPGQGTTAVIRLPLRQPGDKVNAGGADGAAEETTWARI
ncbi:MAG: ATP-binding protein, partial [Desulfobulbus sp.]|nr:ATP-binding protein [Desulfobulbus sp.]